MASGPARKMVGKLTQVSVGINTTTKTCTRYVVLIPGSLHWSSVRHYSSYPERRGRRSISCARWPHQSRLVRLLAAHDSVPWSGQTVQLLTDHPRTLRMIIRFVGEHLDCFQLLLAFRNHLLTVGERSLCIGVRPPRFF